MICIEMHAMYMEEYELWMIWKYMNYVVYVMKRELNGITWSIWSMIWSMNGMESHEVYDLWYEVYGLWYEMYEWK